MGVGQTKTLTVGADAFTGGAGSDRFSAPLADNGATNTFLSSDTVDGGAGNDTLSITLTGAANTLLLSNVSNVENLVTTINQPGTAGAVVVNALGKSFDSIDHTDVHTAASSYLNLGKVPSLTMAQLSAQTLTVDMDTKALTGTADNLIVNITGGNAGALTVSDDGDSALETITLTSSGSANTITTLTTTGLGTSKLVIGGDAPLTIATVTDTQATLKTVDASGLAATAALTIGGTAMIANSTVTGGAGNDAITVSAVAGNDNLSGGAGNDTFTFAANLTADDTVDGGAGTDILSTNVAAVAGLVAGTAFSNVKNVETLSISNASGANTVTTKFISSGINRVNLTTATGAAATVLELGSGSQTVAMTAAAATIAAGQTLTVTADGTGTSDSLTVAVAPTGAEVAQDYLGSATSGLTTTGFETVTIDTGSFTSVAATTQNLGAVNVGAANAITVKGTNSLTVAAAMVANTLDASGLSGNAVLSMGAPTTITSITGTARADTLVGDSSSSINGGAGADTITGGSGNDTILGGDGNDTITTNGGVDSVLGGAGNDTITHALTAGNVINGGDGTDTLSIAVAATTATGAGVTNIEVLEVTANGLSQDMTLFIDNGNSTFSRVNVTGAIGATFTNVGSATNTVRFSAAGTLTGFTRLVDTTTDSLTLEVTGGAGVVSATAARENTITVTGVTSGAAVTVNTLAGVQLQTLNIGTANSSTGNFVIGDTALTAGALSAVNINTTGSVSLGAGGNSSSQNLTINAANASAATIVGGSGADSITGTGAADTLTGGAGNDSLFGGGGVDSLTGGTGADRITTGASADRVVMAITDSVAASATNLTAGGILVGETITFGNGVDLVLDFTAGTGGDVLDTAAITVAAAPTALVGVATTNLTTATNFFASGNFNSTTGVFTIATAGTGSDTLIISALAATAASQAVSTNTNMVILVGVNSGDLVAANFI